MTGGSSFGLMLPVNAGLPASNLVDFGVLAERAGVAAVGCGESNSTEALSLLAAVAARTSHIRLETSVLSVAARSAPLLAMASATLSSISGGRFVLGLGAGSPLVSGWHQRPFDRPLERVRATVDDVRAALRGEVLRPSGFRLGTPLADVPIVISAMNERMTLLSGSVADGVRFNFLGTAEIAGPAAAARRAHAASDRSTTPFEVIAIQWLAVGDRDGARRAFATEMAPYLAVPTYRSAAVAMSSEPAIDEATEAWRRGGRAAATAAFPESIVDALVVDPEPAAVRARVKALLNAGCDGVRLVPVWDRALPASGLASALQELLVGAAAAF